MLRTQLTGLLFLAFLSGIFAQEAETEAAYTEEEIIEMYSKYVDSIEQSLNYERGTVSIGSGIGTIKVPAGFKYLNGPQSEMILTDIWGNPPSEDPDKSLGMLMPEEDSPMEDSMYAINITYSEEGFIKDEDATDIDYDELLSSMQADEEEINEYRVSEGYETIHIVGWATEPFYDSKDKKLYWAKEIAFGGEPEHTLNYNIRVLGRKGYLELNAIGGMHVLPEVQRNIEPILESVSFNEGHRYEDFDPSMDRVAAYGIAGLIAGKVLAKAGILAKIGIFLAKFWKIGLVGLIAFGAGIKRLLGFKEEEKDTPA